MEYSETGEGISKCLLIPNTLSVEAPEAKKTATMSIEHQPSAVAEKEAKDENNLAVVCEGQHSSHAALQ